MTNEQDKTIQGLRTAIQMEIDGKEFYLKASKESKNKLGKKLLESLSREEDNHRRKFEEIYNAIKNKRGWPKVDFQPDGGQKLRTIFARATEEVSSTDKSPSTELEAVQTAMDMENASRDFYTNQAKIATYDTEKEFYENLVSEEKEHYLILLDYYEFLKDPAGWFTVKEHPSLDGG
jgi:rubrerythrin